MNKIYTPDAPEPIGPYSQATEVGNILFLSGQISINPVSGELTGDDVKAQTRQVCENIGNILKAADLRFADVVRTVCYLTNTDDFKEFNEVYAEYYTALPARSCVFVKSLPKGALVEIEVTAYKKVLHGKLGDGSLTDGKDK